MEISEKVAYLKGLAEGLNLDTESKEGKLIAAIIDVLDDMAEKFADVEDELCDVEDGLDAVSDDLSDVEETLYFALDDDEDEDEDEDDDEDDEEVFFKLVDHQNILIIIGDGGIVQLFCVFCLCHRHSPAFRLFS